MEPKTKSLTLHSRNHALSADNPGSGSTTAVPSETDQDTHIAGLPLSLGMDTIEELVNWSKKERHLIGKQVQANMKRMVYPIIDAIREHVPPSRKNLVSLLESCLQDLLSPLIFDLESRFHTLSPREIEICGMISKGYSTKHIATFKNISELTVNDHRKSIRKKLGLTNSRRNLASYLRSTEHVRSEP